MGSERGEKLLGMPTQAGKFRSGLRGADGSRGRTSRLAREGPQSPHLLSEAEQIAPQSPAAAEDKVHIVGRRDGLSIAAGPGTALPGSCLPRW